MSDPSGGQSPPSAGARIGCRRGGRHRRDRHRRQRRERAARPRCRRRPPPPRCRRRRRRPSPTAAPTIPFADCATATFGPVLAPLNPPASVHTYSAAPAMTIDTDQAVPGDHRHGEGQHRPLPAAGSRAEHRQRLRDAGAQSLLRRHPVPPRGRELRRSRVVTRSASATSRRRRRRRRRRAAAAVPGSSSTTSRCISSTSRARWRWPTAAPTPTARSSSSASPTTRRSCTPLVQPLRQGGVGHGRRAEDRAGRRHEVDHRARADREASMRDSNARALRERAERVLPGGVDSPVRAYRAVPGVPPHIVRGEGAHVVDADGNEFIDYVLAYGPHILGHQPPRVVAAVRAQLERGHRVRPHRRARGGARRADRRRRRVGGDGALRHLGHRGGDVRGAPRARGHRPRSDREVRRRLPRPRRRAARRGGLGRSPPSASPAHPGCPPRRSPTPSVLPYNDRDAVAGALRARGRADRGGDRRTGRRQHGMRPARARVSRRTSRHHIQMGCFARIR